VPPLPVDPEADVTSGAGAQAGGEERAVLGQALYRRFRPQRFAELVGQEHVRQALVNAVRNGTVGHAYLFSGPRGTGKTSTARILAKALNCASPVDGEPCDQCPSCREITAGSSLDVFELDAASNNGVEAMRELVAKAALGTPGRTKVYIVDEVHMLSTAAANALLKTLEEPPPHVVFVLATTDPQKVPATVRSRTQHFAFRLLPPEELAALLRAVRDKAGLAVPDEALEAAVRLGRGSARDSLSALDQLAAGGEPDESRAQVEEVLGALAEQDPVAALTALARAFAAGLDPEHLARDLVAWCRQAFLAGVAPDLVEVVGAERQVAVGLVERLGTPRVVRLLEGLGRALVAMRDAPDPRAHLEVAVVDLVGGASGQGGGEAAGGPDPRWSPEPGWRALEQRLARLEEAVARLAPGSETGAPTGALPPTPPAATGRSGPALARRTLGALRRQQAAEREARGGASGEGVASSGSARRDPGRSGPDPGEAHEALSAEAAPRPAGTAGPASGLPTREELTRAWGDGLLQALPPRPRARFRTGRFVAVEADAAVFALPNATHLGYCEEVRSEVEAQLAAHFGRPVPLRLVVDDDPVPGVGGEPGPGGQRGRALAPPAGPEHPEEADRQRGGDLGPEEEALLDPEVLEGQTTPAGGSPDPVSLIKATFAGAEEIRSDG